MIVASKSAFSKLTAHLGKSQAEWEMKWMVDKLLKSRKKGPTRTLIGDKRDEMQLTQNEQRRLNAWIYDRIWRNKPLQYILGDQPFGGLEIKIRPPVLIPRWETEELASRICQEYQSAFKQLQRPRILDLCSGSGCIGLFLASKLPEAQIVGVDASKSAWRLARLNQRQLGIKNVVFVLSDLFDDRIVSKLLELEPEGYDMIVSNPPYVSSVEYSTLDPSVKLWEDERALLCAMDEYGIGFYKRIEDIAPALLSKNVRDDSIPNIVFEVGCKQAELVSRSISQAKWSRINTWTDLTGIERVVLKWR